jgi:CRISPR-associated protein Cmr3
VTLYAIEPRDPVIFRDGRPFQVGSTSARTLDFPWPSTIAGFVRTSIGSNERGAFVHPAPKELLQIPVRGPWLWCWEKPSDHPPELYVPAPRDCVWFKEPSGLQRRRLAPRRLDAGCETSHDSRLELVDLDGERPKEKPAKDTPAFWSWKELGAWLADPAATPTEGAFGLPSIQREERVHVAIDEASGAAREGMIFSTHGLRFTTRDRRRLAIGFSCEDGRLAERQGVVAIGGERRMSFLKRLLGGLPPMPELPALDNAQRLRVILLTPAIFDDGAAPAAIHEAPVVAAAVPRPEVISGWDLASSPPGPKPTRRMAPAGSVYWVELPPGTRARDWAKGVWMKSISSAEQDKRDGFGLAVVGVA